MTEQVFDSSLALDPSRSVVVEACAGSGKTWLLVSRILRALLAGAEPSEILAITFTRKAALEMQARLNEWLELLATADDATARSELTLRGIAEADALLLLPRARSLHEMVLTARPGITLTTFHGWFLEVLKRAPLDAGIAQFELTEQAGMLEKEAWLHFKEHLRRNSEGPLANAFDTLVSEIGLPSTRDLLASFLRQRADWFAITSGEVDDVAAVQRRLSEEVGVAPDTDVPGECLTPAFIQDLKDYAALLARNNSGTTSDHARNAQTLLDALSSTSLETIFDCACTALLTKKSEARKHTRGQTSQRRLGADEPRFFTLHEQLSEALILAKDRLATQRWLALNEAGLICGTALLDEYQALKDQRQVLDFADIEWLTARLLADSDTAEYLQYKLDARYRHVLLDEFQDTSPLQWQILRAWLGASQAAGRAPSVFVVGDPKQSIYRFRGADARLFDEAAAFLEHQGAIRFMHNTTRRLAPAVLEIVNRTFAALAERYPRYQAHEAHEKDLPGHVELIPLFPPPEQPAGTTVLRDPLTTPLTDETKTTRRKEAQHMASRLKEIQASWQVRDNGVVRPVRWSDVLILVRTRKHLAAYEHALRAAGIPAISSRQGGLLDTLEARDLTALLTFLVTPSANLELAHTLRSPLFACSDADLLTLAGNKSWWTALKTSNLPCLARAAELLGRWRGLAGRLPVHDLLDRIFHEGDLLPRYLDAVPSSMRAGVAANLHSLMELALSLSGGRYPSLPRFVFELKQLRHARAEEAPDEADTADGQDAVTLLTVHGAKGLEAPIVWLLDAGPGKTPTDSYRALSDWPPGSKAPRHFSLYFKRELSSAPQRDLLARDAALMETENFNLLYVAMTRARQALFISGNESRADSLCSERDWHAHVNAAFGAYQPPVGTRTHGNDLTSTDGKSAAPQENRRAAGPAITLPPVSAGTRRDKADSEEIRLGVLVHELLEKLAADSPPDEAMLRALPPEKFDPAWRIAQTIRQNAGLKRFFEPGQFLSARNELSVVNSSGQVIRIDRLVEFEEEIWVLDYKTGEADARIDDDRLADRHRAQLDEYIRAVRVLWPGKPVRGGLILGDGRLVML
ncbi:MAG: UvrD-helicase domain-containing protein [Hydrogenophilaceae bacterium]|nr:UvrD-helicase domain-containing protein [Hydrogenophilaceae bacterium]